MTRSILKHISVPNLLWGEAVCHSTYLINRIATRSLDGKTPYETLRNKKPNIEHLRVFGCVCYAITNANILHIYMFLIIHSCIFWSCRIDLGIFRIHFAFISLYQVLVYPLEFLEEFGDIVVQKGGELWSLDELSIRAGSRSDLEHPLYTEQHGEASRSG